jgi:D-3-phosphoglycerate dehydrogenase
MKVLAYDPFIAAERAAQLGVELVELETLLARADVVSIHVPKSEQTRNMLRAESFARMKRGARIVNCARGGVVNEADLVAAIRAGQVAGAALDVFEKEPLDPASPLLGLEEVILTPHLGAATVEAQVNVAVEVARLVIDYLAKGVVRNGVNVPSLDPETIARIGPFLDLASRMGRFLGQLVEGRMEELDIRYSGEVAATDPRPLTATLLEGLLRPILTDEVNLVNAPLIARDRGLKVVESATAETGDFTSLVTATLRTGAGDTTVSGTLFGRRDPRIVRVNSYELELAPAGHLLLFANEDTPGVIGRIGTLLGDNRVNIGGMQLGRTAGSKDALAVLAVDSAIPESVMGAIRALPFIRRARQLEI